MIPLGITFGVAHPVTKISKLFVTQGSLALKARKSVGAHDGDLLLLLLVLQLRPSAGIFLYLRLVPSLHAVLRYFRSIFRMLAHSEALNKVTTIRQSRNFRGSWTKSI